MFLISGLWMIYNLKPYPPGEDFEAFECLLVCFMNKEVIEGVLRESKACRTRFYSSSTSSRRNTVWILLAHMLDLFRFMIFMSFGPTILSLESISYSRPCCCQPFWFMSFTSHKNGILVVLINSCKAFCTLEALGNLDFGYEIYLDM